MAPEQVAIGTQLLAQRPVDEAAEVLEAAVDLGVHWLDVADVYGPTSGDAERLVASVADRVRVVTKGGLVRTGTRWRPDGRASALQAAAEGSRDRLGVEAIDLYLVHAPDPRVAWRTTVRALFKLQERGVVRTVGLSNVTVTQLREALDHGPVACVQVPFSPLDVASVRSGILEVCREREVPVLGYRPFGGRDKVARLARDPEVVALASARGVSVPELVLAWIRGLGVVPLPGPTTVASVASCVRAATLSLTVEEQAVLDAAWPAAARWRVPRTQRAPPAGAEGEVRIVMGCPGAGKTTAVQAFEAQGYHRLNRDLRGGTLAKLVRELDRVLGQGHRRVVLDNTYPSRASRYDVIDAAWAHGVPVRCSWLDTPPADCERNVVDRILGVVGHLPEPAGLAKPTDPAVVPPRALLRFWSTLEEPDGSEGFVAVDRVPFVRAPPEASGCGVVCDPRHLDPFEDWLAAAAAQGWTVLVAGWVPGAEAETAARDIESAAEVPLHAAVCVHPAGPPVCWCRKPWVGLPVALARAHGVDLGRSVAIATTPADRTLAAKLGLPTVTSPDEPVPPAR